LSAFGKIVEEEWHRSAAIRPEIELDEFVVMPDHIHGIVWMGIGQREPFTIRDPVGAHRGAPLPVPTPITDPGHARPPRSLGSFVAGFKSIVTKRINHLRGTPGTPVWQRNYYERIIRDHTALSRIRRYILANPAAPRWPR
jgi:putative transposase